MWPQTDKTPAGLVLRPLAQQLCLEGVERFPRTHQSPSFPAPGRGHQGIAAVGLPASASLGHIPPGVPGACRGGAEASQALGAGEGGRPRQQKPRLWVGSRTLASPGCWKPPASGRSGCCRRVRRKHSSGCRARPCSPAAPANGATSASWPPGRCPALTTHVSPGQWVTLSGLQAGPLCGVPHPTLQCSWGSSPCSRAHVLGSPHSSPAHISWAGLCL